MCFSVTLGACTNQPIPASTPEAPVAPPASSGSLPPKEKASVLPPLTAGEQRLAAELKEVATRLVGFGERNVAHEWELAAATDYIASTLEAQAHEVVRLGFTNQGRLAQSLEVVLPGKTPGAPTFVIGARFDSPLGSPAANDAASGAAALLVLARELGQKSRERALRLVFFSDASNRAEPAAGGAPAYFAYLKKHGVRVAAMLELSGLGRYRQSPGTQSYPEYSPAQNRTIGDFIALGSYADLSPDSAMGFFDELSDSVGLPFNSMVLLPNEASVLNSPHRFFADQGIPAFILFDTHRYRDPLFGGPGDTIERLDFERMARVVAGLVGSLEALTTRLQEAGDSTGEEPR